MVPGISARPEIVLGGALGGAGLESDVAVREAAYAYRPDVTGTTD
jgi:hypothetical protein